MDERFADFLSEELLEFCSYDTHENNYMADALTNLSTKEIHEYFLEYCEDYCSTNMKCMGKNNTAQPLAQTSKSSSKSTPRNFATPKTDNEVAEARKMGVPLKTRNGVFQSGKTGLVIEERLQRHRWLR